MPRLFLQRRGREVEDGAKWKKLKLICCVERNVVRLHTEGMKGTVVIKTDSGLFVCVFKPWNCDCVLMTQFA
jgi:hypothetical protein